MLCDLDNVIRFYDMAPVAELELAAGLAESTTAKAAYVPEVELPLLLGKITPEEWVDSIASALSDRLPLVRALELGKAFAGAPFRADDVVVALLRRVRGHMPLVLVTSATLEPERDLESMGWRISRTTSSAAPRWEWPSRAGRFTRSPPRGPEPPPSSACSWTTGWRTSRPPSRSR